MSGFMGVLLAVGGVAVATTKWNPSDKGTGVSLSGGDLTYSGANDLGVSVRSIASHATGKYYWEVLVNHRQGFSATCVGIADGTHSVANAVGGGADDHSIAWRDNGAVNQGGATLATVESFADGDVLGFALDVGNGKIWFRKNGGNWNNDGSANPATNTNGIDTSLTGAQFAAGDVGSAGSGDTTSMTANFGATAYAQTPPSGFGNW